jgi:hypothetical protein
MAKEIHAKGRTWSPDIIRHEILHSRFACERAILRIYANQTADEQNAKVTAHHNRKGFTGSDAYILSSFAEQILKGRTLSEKQLAIAHRKMPKYAVQIFNHIKSQVA